MIVSLLWKQWREERWKAVGIFGVYAAMVVTAYLLSRRDGFEMAEGCIFAISFLVPGFVAMGTITQERARRTDETMRVLPVGRGAMFFSRVGGGIATMVVPLVAIQGICWLVNGGRESPVIALRVVLVEMGLMVALYLWTLALGARMRSEAALGLVSIGVLLGCGLATAVFDILSGPIGIISEQAGPIGITSEPVTKQILEQLLPTGFATLIPDFMSPQIWPLAMHSVIPCVALQVLELIGVGFLAYWRMNLPVRVGRGVRPAVAARGLVIARERRMPILWKTWREARLVVVGYVVIAESYMACMAGVIWWGIREAIRHRAQGPDGMTMGASETIAIFPGIVAVLVTVIVGVDIGMRDFENRLEGFWQSRPINAGNYMGRRFWAGLAALMPVLLLVPAMGLVFELGTWMMFPGAWGREPIGAVSWDPVYIASWFADRVGTNGLMFLIFYVPQAQAVYGFSVLCATLTRRRVLSLVMGIGVALALQMLFGLTEMQEVMKQIKQLSPAMGAYEVVMLAVTGLLGWLAVMSVKWGWREWFERKIGRREVVVVGVERTVLGQ